MQYADLQIGQRLTAGPYRVDEAEIIEFASRWDAQPFHVNRELAQSTQWQGVIASGWHTSVIAMKLAVEAVLKDSSSCGSPGLEYLKWPHPVRPGDDLRLEIQVLELRNSRTRDYGIVRWQWQLFNQRNDVVFDTVAVSLFGINVLGISPKEPS